MLKAKEREVECLMSKVSEKDDLLKKYCCQIEDLKKDLKNKCKKYREILKQLKAVRNESGQFCEEDLEKDPCDSDDIGELLSAIVKNVEDQRKLVLYQLQNAESQIKSLSAENNLYLKERNEIAVQLQNMRSENDKLLKDVNSHKKSESDKEELLKTVEVLKSEKKDLLEKVKILHENIQELNNNFKETRWALTSEVAEKHDQVQDLKRCVGVLEEQLRQADMQTHFKDDIIKELRKELRSSKKSLSNLENSSKLPSVEKPSPQLSSTKPVNISSPHKKGKDDELKLDIHIFPINETKSMKIDLIENEKPLDSHSVEVQTEFCRSPSSLNKRNVSTQYKTSVQKLPRSFGTLTVTPWSGAAGEITRDDNCLLDIKEERRGLYDVVNELRERKGECSLKGKFSKSLDVIKCQSCGTGSDNSYSSATSALDRQDTSDDRKNTCEKEKLLSQIDCLKKNFKLKVEELKNQEDLANDLEEELLRTKTDFAILQEKFEEHKCRIKSGESSTLETNLKIHHATLVCAVNIIEEALRTLLQKHSCRLSNFKSVLEAEMEKICSVKNHLEKNKSKPSTGKFSQKSFEDSRPCSSSGIKCHFQSSLTNQSNVVSFEDIEKFREKSVMAVVALEQMKEQIDILENLIKKYTKEFPCGCDKELVEGAEDKLNKLREEFDVVTDQLCQILQRLNKSSAGGSYDSFSLDGALTPKEGESIFTQNTYSVEELNKLKTDYQRFQKQICDQENAAEKLKKMSKQLEEEIQQKRDQLIQHTKEIDAKMCEISKLRELIRKVCRRLKEVRFDHTLSLNQEADSSPEKNISNLSGLFCDLKELWCILEKSVTALFDGPKKLKEDNEKLREQVECLEKCVCNKEETIKFLQDTVKLKECQIEELKSKMQSSESQSCKLAQDVEEKCRLISNLQEAIQKCKQFEFFQRVRLLFEKDPASIQREILLKLIFRVHLSCQAILTLKYNINVIDGLFRNLRINFLALHFVKCNKTNARILENMYIELIESLRFEYCELECKLEKYEKEVLLKDQKLESLQLEITSLSSKNFLLNEKIKIMDPKLKIMYKTCHLFEKTVNNLQEELNNRECEIESLYKKIKELEIELEREFKKCEERAAEDSKCIEELSMTVENFQKEHYCLEESYKKTIKEAECKLKKELEKETELSSKICKLENEIKNLKNQINENAQDTANNKFCDLEGIIKRAECQQELYERKIIELQKNLECVIEEHEKEKKDILQKLGFEKKENLKNKSLITKLNENIKRKTLQERTLRECIDHYSEDLENLKAENKDLKTEIEARKKIMSTMEKGEAGNLTELEELICSLKIQKAELKAKSCNLKAEVDKEEKLKKLLECRVKDLDSMLQSQVQEFNQMVANYKCTSARIQQTYSTMKDVEEKLISSLNNMKSSKSSDQNEECNCLKKALDIKTAENAKLICQIQVMKVETETIQNESTAVLANKEVEICHLQHEVECLENDLQEFQTKCQKLIDENKKLHYELETCVSNETAMQNEFREKQRDICAKLRVTVCEKNDLLSSLNEMQKQLEQICLENVNKERKNRELTEECSRLKTSINSNEDFLKNKSDKIICSLNKEIKSLQCELCEVKENFRALKEEYDSVLERLKCCEKKKCNTEKMFLEVNNENKTLLEAKEKSEKELCELKTQNCLLKDKLTNKAGKEGSKNLEEKKKMCEKIKELTGKLRTLEKKVIPELNQEITEKLCCIENLKFELREANISNQRMRNEALKVIHQTRKYLAAQKCVNETLKSRLECSNKRGNMLGAENKELEEHLKAVTRMNEFLLCQLDNTKNFSEDTEPRSISPLPWGCSIVDRDTSSSEYLAESGFQSMQPSPTNLDYARESPCDNKRNNQWSSPKKHKYGGSLDCPSHRSGLR